MRERAEQIVVPAFFVGKLGLFAFPGGAFLGDKSVAHGGTALTNILGLALDRLATS